MDAKGSTGDLHFNIVDAELTMSRRLAANIFVCVAGNGILWFRREEELIKCTPRDRKQCAGVNRGRINGRWELLDQK